MNKKIGSILSEISEVSGYLWKKGWAEANAGNISYNITDIRISETIRIKQPCIKLKKKYSALKNASFIITASGSKMRNLVTEPGRNICFLKISDDGNYYSLHNLTNNNLLLKPTSELYTHLSLHNHFVATGRKEKAILHTHPAEVIAVTHLRKYKSTERLNKLANKMMPEVKLIIDKGLCFIPYALTGSRILADESIKKLEDKNLLVWEKHGLVSFGENLQAAFDIADVFIKSLRIFFLCKCTGSAPEGLSKKQLKDLDSLIL